MNLMELLQKENPFAGISKKVFDVVTAPDVANDIKKAIELTKSPDMNTETVFERAKLIVMKAGITRTWVLANAAFAGIFGAIVGLTEDQVVETVRGVYKVMAAHASTPAIVAEYNTANGQYQQAKSQAVEVGADSDLAKLAIKGSIN